MDYTGILQVIWVFIRWILEILHALRTVSSGNYGVDMYIQVMEGFKLLSVVRSRSKPLSILYHILCGSR